MTTSGRAASMPSRTERRSSSVNAGRRERHDLDTPCPPVRRATVATWPFDPVTAMRIMSNRSCASLSRGQRLSLSDRGGPAGGKRPFHADIGVVPGDAAVVRRRIGRCRLVEDLGVRLERDEAMREADRDEQLAPVLGRQFDRRHGVRRSATSGGCRPRRRECGRGRPARACPGRRAGSGNAVRAACRPRPKTNGCPGRTQSRARPVPCRLVVDLGEEAACVPVFLRRHDLDRRDRRLFNLHCRATRTRNMT